MSSTLAPTESPSEMKEMLTQHFHWLDYAVCALMFGVSIGVGLFYGFCHKSKNAQDYLMGGRKMPLVPVSMSLIASFISGISIMGIPAETYFFGIQYVYIAFGITLGAFIFVYVYLPVFYNLKVTSIFEYLERRFDKNIRILTSVLFAVTLVAWLPIVIYVPAMAINQVAGIDIHIISPIICVICIFYTSLGGIKAVVWTDVIQGVSMFGAILVVAIKGTYDLGGFGIVWQRNFDSGRIEPPILDTNFMTRHTIWTLGLGGCLHYIQCGGIHQTMYQRYVSLSSLTSAKKAALIFVGGMMFILFTGGYVGSLMYATYYDCDPWSSGIVSKKEQILVVLVMKVMGNYPGLLGVFVAGILSASLSSLSTGLNSMAAVVLEDFYHAFYTKPLTERQSSIIMKTTTVILGVLCVLLVYVVEQLGTVLQLSMSLSTIGNGPAFGIFTIGILLPWVKSKGTLAGGLSSVLFMTYLCFRAQAAIATGELMFEQKPLSTEGCGFDFTPKNSTVYVKPESALHHVSYLWYTFSGAASCIIVALIVSCFTECLDPSEVDPELISPLVRRFFKTHKLVEKEELKEVEYYSNYDQSKEKNGDAYISLNPNSEKV